MVLPAAGNPQYQWRHIPPGAVCHADNPIIQIQFAVDPAPFSLPNEFLPVESADLSQESALTDRCMREELQVPPRSATKESP